MKAGIFRRALGCGMLAAVTVASLAPGGARAQAPYPSRIIKLVVGFAAGGGNDIIAQKMQEDFGQTVIVENRPGASGALSAEFVKRATPDGYTLLVGASGAMTVVPAISVHPPYHGTRDFTPISMVASFPLILSVHPEGPAKSLQELIAWTKANPDK